MCRNDLSTTIVSKIALSSVDKKIQTIVSSDFWFSENVLRIAGA